MDERRIKRNIWTTLTLGAGFSLIAIASMTGEETNTQPNIGASPENGSESLGLTPSDLEQEGWDPNCVTINNPIDSYYNDGLPYIPNTYRAVKAAGNPDIVENGPYLHIPGYLGTAVRKSQGIDTQPYEVQALIDFNPWNEFGQPKPYIKVHNGDRICIKKNVPQSFNINPKEPRGTVFVRSKRSIGQENNRFAKQSLNIQASIRSRNWF